MTHNNQNELPADEDLPPPKADTETPNATEEVKKEITNPASLPIESPLATTPNEILNTETMEVHHHGHVHEQKKWKEYLFQFFMLFLAVFCGFMAEYQLEQTIERNRETEYIESFVNDVKLDTAQIQLRSRSITKSARGIDSLIAASRGLTEIKNRQLFAYFIKHVPSAATLVLNEGTMLQLKNAGGLRLIKKKGAVDSILVYDSYNRGIEGQAMRYRDNVVKGIDASDAIFDWKTFDGVNPDSLLTSEAIFLANPDNDELHYFINRLIRQKDVSVIYRNYLQNQHDRASRIIAFLQKEYDL